MPDFIFPLPTASPGEDFAQYIPLLVSAVDSYLDSPSQWSEGDYSIAHGRMEQLIAWLGELPLSLCGEPNTSNMKLISDTVLAATATTVTITVPTGLNNIVLIGRTRLSTVAERDCRVQFNGITSSVYKSQTSSIYNLTHSIDHVQTTYIRLNSVVIASNAAADEWGYFRLFIPKLPASQYPTFEYFAAGFQNTIQGSGRMRSAVSEISSITLFTNSGDFAIGTSFKLYEAGDG